MNAEQIMEVIKRLAQSQGFYGRLYMAINESPERDDILKRLEKRNFKDSVDLVMYFET